MYGSTIFWPFVLWFVAVCLATSCLPLSKRWSCILNKSHSIIPCSSCTPRAPQAPPNVWSILWGWVLTVYWRCWLKKALYTEFEARPLLEWGLKICFGAIKCRETSLLKFKRVISWKNETEIKSWLIQVLWPKIIYYTECIINVQTQ